MATLLPLVAPGPAAAVTHPVRPPVIDGDWADPEVVHDPDSGRWYSFATNFTVFGFQFNVPVRSSSDLVDWPDFGGDALPTLPAWATSGRTWAPGVARIGSQWTMWFTAHHAASDRQCIGVATSVAPEGPYAPVGTEPLVCQVDRGGSIDARPFVDPATGSWWLHWKSDENAPGVSDPVPRIWAAQLGPGGTSLLTAPTEILRHELAVEVPAVEAPAMVHAAGQYWLWYSAGPFTGAGYHTHVARCAGPAGPCTRQPQPDDPFLGGGSLTVGPGGASLVPIDAQRWAILFHGWRGAVGYDQGGYRASYVEVVTFDGSGGAPRLRTDLPRVPPASSSADGTVELPARAPSVAGTGAGRIEAWSSPSGPALLRYGTTQPRSWGGILATGPDVATSADGTVAMVATAPDRTIWMRTATRDWRSLGGLSDHPPAIASWGPGRFDVLARGIDGALYHRASGDGGQTWSAWVSLGGSLIEGPDVASAGAGQLDVVAQGLDGAAWHLAFRGSWQPWRSIGGRLRGAPSIAPSGSQLVVVAQGLDRAVWLQRAAPGWTGWVSLGGQTDDRPGIGGTAGQVAVVARGLDGRRWRNDVVGGVASGWLVSG